MLGFNSRRIINTQQQHPTISKNKMRRGGVLSTLSGKIDFDAK